MCEYSVEYQTEAIASCKGAVQYGVDRRAEWKA